MRFTNPVISGFHPDPSICRAGEDYFLVTSSFEYFPGVPLFHSRDLVHWRQIGHCLTRPSQLPMAEIRPSGGIFAPTIRHHNGTFYMVTTNVTGGGNFYVSTNDPFGEWSEPIWVEQGGIDPSLFFDDDGRVYFTSNFASRIPVPDEIDPATFQWGIQQSEIDIATGKLRSEPRVIWHGTGGKYPEAPHLYKIGGSYYLMIAEGGTEYGHMETIARSATPWGPWQPCPHNPILSHRSLQSPIQGLGHADLIEAHDGSWWLVCLGFRPQGYPPCYHLGRETFLAPVAWDAAGWPWVGDSGRILVAQEAPHLTPVAWDPPAVRDDFDAPVLRPEWNSISHPSGAWSLTVRPGALCLHSGAALDTWPPPAWIGRRQQHLSCEATTLLDFTAAGDTEAGITVWMNPRHHYDLFVTGKDGQRYVGLRRRIGDLTAVEALEPIGVGPVRLGVRADPAAYQFSYALADTEPHLLGQGETRYLATEVAGGFTGVFFALYVAGTDTAAPAYFEWFEYRA